LTPYLSRPAKLTVISAIDLLPPITRFEIGQEMKASFGSTSVTSIAPSDQSLRYLAAVSPP
jgi:hypothetical protein